MNDKAVIQASLVGIKNISKKEVWKKIPSMPKHYQASSLGRIRCVEHTEIVRGFKLKFKGEPKYGFLQKKTNRYVLRTKKPNKTFRIARLICEAFHGKQPKNKPFCIHIDENPMNNTPENLKWGTRKENMNFPKYLEYCRTRDYNIKNLNSKKRKNKK